MKVSETLPSQRVHQTPGNKNVHSIIRPPSSKGNRTEKVVENSNQLEKNSVEIEQTELRGQKDPVGREFYKEKCIRKSLLQ